MKADYQIEAQRRVDLFVTAVSMFTLGILGGLVLAYCIMNVTH